MSEMESLVKENLMIVENIENTLQSMNSQQDESFKKLGEAYSKSIFEINALNKELRNEKAYRRRMGALIVALTRKNKSDKVIDEHILREMKEVQRGLL